MIRTALICCFLATKGAAQEVTTDAFGVFPSSRLEGRGDWAGYRSTSGGAAKIQGTAGADAAILFVGPKSIVAGLEPGHAVALVLDLHGNMLDGVATDFELGFGDTVRVNTRTGIADHLFRPPPAAGVMLAGASVEAVQSARADYRVTAHLATVQPTARPNSESILQETFGEIATVPLADKFGNVVDDGVGLGIVLTDHDGHTSFLPAVVRDGIAQSTLLSRDIAGPVSGQIALAGTQSDGVLLNIDRLVLTDIGETLIWPAPAIDAIHLRVGPLQTDRGYLVPDGTPAQLQIAGQTGLPATTGGWVLDGYLAFTIPLPAQSAPFDISLVLSGNMHRARVDLSDAPKSQIVRGAE